MDTTGTHTQAHWHNCPVTLKLVKAALTNVTVYSSVQAGTMHKEKEMGVGGGGGVIERQTDRQTGRQKGRQTDRHCVCVCACVRACVRACVCVCV